MNQRRFLIALMLIVLVIITTSLVLAQVDGERTGETVLLQGQVLDTDGNPIAGAVVEIWQTDVDGNYNHPNDTATADLREDFQYFGTATTDDEGYYAFLTIKPAAYEPRPAHIHFKVKIDGETVLTSQFYFEEDREVVENDGAFANAGDTLFLQTVDSTDTEGNPVRIATGNIVLDLNGDAADSLTPTASQTEGPYYPVIDFSDYDNDLTSVSEDDAVVLPMLESPTEFTRLNLNTATSDEFAALPDMSSRMVREFEEYRPYISILQFRREIGKYVSDDQVAAYEQFIYVPININESDTATLMQIPGVDEAAAEQLIAGRPYASHDSFLEAVAEIAPDVDIDYAAYYLEAE